MSGPTLRRCLLMIAIATSLAGCGSTVDTSHGRSRGASVNGTGAFAELLRQRGHQVRVARRANETLADWANVIVRFAHHPGLPDKEEGEWLEGWLAATPGRKLVYVVHDFDAASEFWDAMLAELPTGTMPDQVEQVTRNRDAAKPWAGSLPPKPKDPAEEDSWFAFEKNPGDPIACQMLDGPWAEGVDVKAAAVSKHEAFDPEFDETMLLIGDGSPLAISWSLANGSQILALANESFLLNAALLNRARRPLTMRVVDWIGEPPLRIAFVEGASPLSDEPDESNSPFRLLQVPPFNFISPHLLGFLLLLAFSFAVRLGRPLREPPSGVERPAAHPEALGALLAKTGRADSARFLLEAYRRWRHPSLASGRKAPAPPPPSR
jgi:hypothetical protein